MDIPDVSDQMIEMAKAIREHSTCSEFMNYDSKIARWHHFINHPKYTIQETVNEAFYLMLPLYRWTPIQSPVGQLASYLNYDDIFDGVKTAAEIMTIIALLSPIFEIVRGKNSEDGRMNIRCVRQISHVMDDMLKSCMYLPPSLVEPRIIRENFHNGYMTQKGSIILGKGNHHNNPQNYEALNIASSVKLAIDTDVILNPEPYSNDMDTEEKRKAHDAFVEETKVVVKHLLDADNEFYFTWKYDKRGRMYSQGYHVNIQSTEYRKAMISLANKEIIK